jgi:hypothetical protein
MSTTTSPPATTLTEVVVTNEQTRAPWRAGRASIDAGAIVITVTGRRTVPPELAEDPRSTFTITAVDGGGRARRFDSLKVDFGRTRLPRRVAFR